MESHHKKLISLSSNSIILGILLAIVGGYLDAYTFVSRDGVFANAQTGNMVIFAMKVVNEEWDIAFLYLSPIFAFIIGVLVSEIIKTARLRDLVHSYRRSILILECLILFTVGILPESVPNVVVVVCISFVSSLQISTFNKVENWAYNSTATTVNLRSASQAAYALFIEHNHEAKKQFTDFSLHYSFFFIRCFCEGHFLPYI